MRIKLPQGAITTYVGLELSLLILVAVGSFQVTSTLTYSSIFSAAIALKVGILLLEAQRKSRWVNWDEKEHGPEETSGIFSLGVFF
jgi:hypothetical protein